MLFKKLPIFVILLFANICVILGERDLPAYYPRCYRDDPDLNQCLLNATEQVRPFLQKGVPELNVPPISPFYVPEVNLQLGTDSISYKSSLTNVTVTGLDTYKFTKFDFDVKKLLFTGAVTMGKINIKGNYSIKGKILTVPIEGKGQLDTTVVSSNGSLVQQAKLVTRRGKTYLESEKTKIHIDVGEVQSKMDGLFDGNEVLAKAADNVIKENLQEIVEEVKPAVEEVFTQIMEGILFKSVYRIPYEKLYPLHNQKS
ncbi:protein takeout-like [Tribolium castaneum]|uniref:Protein takeout-like Protein n=1 Tax=Tribolium castaneum TaxID=7070 RepID=D6WKI2_TRICA|nr:Protein takeout-like Protein [Tribolium castaneum]